MKLVYISPSVLPSKSANAVHVVLQCAALKSYVSEIKLFAKRSVKSNPEFLKALKSAYGVEFDSQDVVSYYSKSSRGENIKIALAALVSYFLTQKPDIILSRNLYASFILGVIFRRKMLFETHQLETGFRKHLQRFIMTRPWVTTVVISERLVDFLKGHHGVSPRVPLVLHDAAPAGIQPANPDDKLSFISRFLPSREEKWQGVCGYFGHLYPGRGIEVIEAMARERPGVAFLVFGGNEEDVTARRKDNESSNLVFVGHVPYPVAQQAMKSVDVLLMPYQASVSIGLKGHDTAQWMSPMKMFEYMAAGVPLISSDLPALREVLKDGKNALLVEAASAQNWISALDKLLSEPEYGRALGVAAHEDYLEHYTWERRAQRLISAGLSKA